MRRQATRAFYLMSGGGEPVYALFDGPAGDADRPAPTAAGAHAPDPALPYSGGRTASGAGAGVLLLPLFGNDDLCAYRARREWANALAAAGHPTLRIDLPSTGDSAGGPHDPGRVRAWTDALAAAAAWLRGEAGCGRVAAIGIGLGGLLAYSATATGAGAAIDDLVLWAVPARGRTFVRQLRALARMEASHDTTTASRGALTSAGFAMSAETLAALEALDLAELDLPGGAARRILLLERDGLAVDERLRATLERSGADVTVAPGSGYGAMVVPPQQSHPPLEVFETVGGWLANSPTAPATPGGRSPETLAIATAATLELDVAGVRIRETPLTIPHGEGRLTGVLAEPNDPIPRGEARLTGALAEPNDPAPLCAVLLNAGALRHIGPNRMWVESARRWAARGVPTLRIDLAGIGDADGDADALERDEGFYVERYVEQTHEVLAALTARGLPPRFVLAGLCSGAYWAFHAALADERVRGAFMVNPRALFWDASIDGVRNARNARKALRPATWRKLVRGQITRERAGTIARGVGVALVSLPRRARAARRERDTGRDELGRALERLGASETRLLCVFTAGEPVLEELQRDGGLERMRAWPNVRIESIPGPPASHTLEPPALQRGVHALLDDALTRLLDEAKNPSL